MIDVEKEAEEILETIDHTGNMKRCSLAQWIEFLEILSVGVDARHQAAKEDQRQEGA